jgi:hypothetical protein
MKLCNIDYAEALNRHPNEVAKIINALRKSKSKEKNANLQEIVWSYEYCVIIENSGSLADLLSGKIKFPFTEPEDPVADYLRRSMTSLVGEIRRWRSSESVSNPPELELCARKMFDK